MPVKVQLEEAFSESCLPFRIDVRCWDETTEEYRRLIDREWELVQDA
jgi:hypothetical protein